jgi:DNA-binding CsgD family transcriptional regulator
VSVKPVEYHLRNSYMKLDITSRRELATLLH